LSRIVEKYKEGMITFYPDGKIPKKELERIREEKRAILKKFGHEDVEPII
jgi:hypothetical protein